MFEAVLKDYDRTKKAIEKENGKLNIFFPQFLTFFFFIETIKKNLKLLAEPLTKGMLHGLNDVKSQYLLNISLCFKKK